MTLTLYNNLREIDISQLHKFKVNLFTHLLRAVNKLITTLLREVLFAEEVLSTFDVVIRLVLVLLRHAVQKIVLSWNCEYRKAI